MEVDWDLQAVVRSCINRNTSDSSSCAAVSSQKSTCSEYLLEPRRGGEEQSLLKLNHHLHKAFCLKPEDSLNLLSHQLLSVSNSSKSHSSKHSPTPRSKRRKTSMMKRVCHVAAENLSSDVWSWRKYGQKPIKGSPYPRGYYRCSTSKGCMARKQVERNRSDPGMFVVTYTSEHNHPMPTHRNSLAGTTRQSKPPSQETVESKSPEIFETSSMEYLNGVVEDDEDEDFSTLDMALDVEEDFFEGLEDFRVPESFFPVTCEG